MDQKSYYERVKASPAVKTQYGWNAQSRDMKTLLGLKGTAKLPREGMPAQVIQGVKVWVAAHTPAYRKDRWTGKMVEVKSSTHRVMAECPRCGQHMSAGRLHQHLCKGE
jgi:hypothetical protein